MATSKHAWLEQLPLANPPIKYLTENGFSIIRISEIDSSWHDSPTACRFLVERNDQRACEVIVTFVDRLVASLQARRQIPLSVHSALWTVCAESLLATYLWENDHLPPSDEMIIDHLSPDELMLAQHWRDSNHE